MAESRLEPTTDMQRLVVTGLLKNSYLLSLVMDKMDDGYFTDSSCRIIYRSLSDFYENYLVLPTEDEMRVAIDRNYVEIGDSKETVKENLHAFYQAPHIEEDSLKDTVEDFIRKIQVRRSLKRNAEKLKNGVGIDDGTVATDLIDSLKVNLSKTGILQLSDLDGLSEARHEAVGEGDGDVIKSMLPAINESLQYHGYQRGTLNLIISPPGCFVGSTRVITDRDSHMFETLHFTGCPVKTFGCSSNGKVVSATADEVYMSGYCDELVDVYFDGCREPIRCTPDHPFMLKGGGYKQARYLTGEDRLMFTCGEHDIVRVSEVHLDDPVPVYGLVNALPYHNYAIELDNGDGVFVSNTGKTSYLINEGAYAAMQGFNALHVFLGDMIHYDGFIRYVSCISGELQNDVIAMPEEGQLALIERMNSEKNDIMNRIGVLSYGAAEITPDQLFENINAEQERSGIHWDDIIVDYADNFLKDNTQLYAEGGAIYDKLALYARKNHSVIMVASQPKLQYWGEEIIPLDGASESSKKQHVVDLAMTFNLVGGNRAAKVGSFYIPKVRRGTSGRVFRVKTEWERCRLTQITENDYEIAKVAIQNGGTGQNFIPNGESKPDKLAQDISNMTSIFDQNPQLRSS